jgi:predicted P-loop ATPase
MLEEIIHRDLGNALSYDEMRQRVLLHGDPLGENDVIKIGTEICRKRHFASVDDGLLHAMLVEAAKARSFNVVSDYLERLRIACVEPVAPTEILPKLGLSADDPKLALYARYLECFLIAAVARSQMPGVKHDTVLVLSGPQGAGKSTFFRILCEAAGPGLFHDGICSVRQRDDLMVMNRHWILEWAEIDDLISHSSSGRVKAFLSAQTDNYRSPYARLPAEHPRHFVLAATTNESAFLNDPTGARRFHVIPVGQIDLTWVRANQDGLWAWAGRQWASGADWHLTQQESHAQAELAQSIQIEHSRDVLFAYLDEQIPAETTRIDATEAYRYFSEFKSQFRSTDVSNKDYSNVMEQLGFSRERLTKTDVDRPNQGHRSTLKQVRVWVR